MTAGWANFFNLKLAKLTRAAAPSLPKLTPNARLLLLELSACCDPTGRTYTGMTTFASRLAMSDESIRSAAKLLQAQGILRFASGSGHRATLWQLNLEVLEQSALAGSNVNSQIPSLGEVESSWARTPTNLHAEDKTLEGSPQEFSTEILLTQLKEKYLKREIAQIAAENEKRSQKKVRPLEIDRDQILQNAVTYAANELASLKKVKP